MPLSRYGLGESKVAVRPTRWQEDDAMTDICTIWLIALNMWDTCQEAQDLCRVSNAMVR